LRDCLTRPRVNEQMKERRRKSFEKNVIKENRRKSLSPFWPLPFFFRVE